MNARFSTSLLFTALVSLSGAAIPAPQNFAVDATYDAPDANPGDGICDDGSGHCTLRAAVMEANALAGDQVIQLGAGTYALSVTGNSEQFAVTGDLDVRDTSGSLTIRGVGSAMTSIDATGLDDRLFDVLANATLVLEDLTITGGGITSAVVDAGAILVSSADLVLERCVVSNCASTNRGGALFVQSGGTTTATLTANDTTFTGNYAALSGVLSAVGESTDLTFTNCVVSGNSAAGRTAGIATNVGANVTLDHCTFTDNNGQLGGALFLVGGGYATITDTTFTDNSSTSSGGAAFLASVTATISDCDFVRNSCPAGGGALAGSNTDLTITDSLFAEHTTNQGTVSNTGSLTMVRCTLVDNVTGGGGAVAASGTVKITDCQMERNSCVTNGSAIAVGPGSIEVADCLIADNSSSTNRGAVTLFAGGVLTMTDCSILRSTGSALESFGTAAVMDCVIADNEVAAWGTISQLSSGTLSVDSCRISGNSGANSGGVYVDGGAADVANCTIDQNVGNNGAGAAYVRAGGSLDVSSSTLSDNLAHLWAGAAYVEATGALVLSHCTVTHNTSNLLGPGGMWNSGDVTLDHTILASNVGATFPDGEAVSGTFTSLGHNLIGDAAGLSWVASVGDIVGVGAAIDPLLGALEDNGGPMPTRAPLIGSPVLDAGDNVSAPATDQRGLPRIVDGNGDGLAVIDIGSVEADLNLPPTAVAGPDQSVHPVQGVQLDGSASFDDNTVTGNLLFAWSFDSIPVGSAAILSGASTPSPSFVADVPGTYLVQLVVTDEAGLTSLVDEVAVSSTNLAPIADAGTQQGGVVDFPVNLDGSASSDPEGDLLTFSWSLTQAPAGSQAVLSGAATSSSSFVPDVAGVYVAQLVVLDVFEASAPDQVTVTVITGEEFAELETMEALDTVAALAPEAVTTSGNQQALINFQSQAIQAIQNGDLAEALDKLQKAIDRTDGCALRGAPDGNGPGRDWVVDCSEQAEIYASLVQALAAISN